MLTHAEELSTPIMIALAGPSRVGDVVQVNYEDCGHSFSYRIVRPAEVVFVARGCPKEQ